MRLIATIDRDGLGDVPGEWNLPDPDAYLDEAACNFREELQARLEKAFPDADVIVTASSPYRKPGFHCLDVDEQRAEQIEDIMSSITNDIWETGQFWPELPEEV